ncbi:bifunctional GDP-fucose synthetase: GDP-4-dehydro-6-deoxy-D-mannose epimerase and GDP-4-dehydro-6-L-deoxygalactose reductase [uncultured Desulfobacterium sp.]|uniref:GDP-L-fucose synthase n=1 Tax=uncultured Desulfobacterium sp. TaxID=201089 RepID=A0A445MUI8_9BACT|nr:bifunctional GDP-fucose synthetase: GDP-4-dehydro-6-deoxy-D-mannose epimerase and GDP-4-dehydro-6-L-deoxygalactose reductase [uncultured Desulfobacterium sp.]
MNKTSKIFVAGHRGLVGSAIVNRLQSEGFNNIICRTHKELDLSRQADVEAFFKEQRPEYVFLAAAKVGGILGNSTYPADFIYINLAIQSNIIHASYLNGVKKLLFLGSSCIYPKYCPQPMKEEHLLSGYLEPTNEPYAIAKIAGIKMCQAYNRQYGTRYISVMPTNLYGPNDNFDLETSHVLPALIRKFHEAKIKGKNEVEIWGTGTPRRELMHVADLADACVFLMRKYDDSEIVNIGTGKDLTIKELAETVAGVTGFKGALRFDTSKPDGTPLKLLDVSKINQLGWYARIDIETGIRDTYDWYVRCRQ